MRTLFSLIVLSISCFYSQAATLTVCASGCDHTTIADAITAASSGDIIDIQDAIHTEAGIIVDKNLTIQGQGQRTTTVQAAATQATATDGVFVVNVVGLTVTFQDLRIRNGNAISDSGSTIFNDGGGGYIRCDANTNINLNRVTITNNRADNDDGGGVYISGDDGTVSFTDCVISNNEANTSDSGADGGGVHNIGAAFLNFNRCTITGNRGGDDGGGVYNFENGSTMNFINCTIANNTTGSAASSALGGGLALQASGSSCIIINCTIVENTLTTASTRQGGGILHLRGNVELINTIVANNSGASSSTNGDDFYANNSSFSQTITQTTSLVEDCDDGSGTCPTFSYTSDANIATTPIICGVQAYYDIRGSDAENNGTAPGGNIPTDDICGNTRSAAHDIGSVDILVSLPVELVFFKGQASPKGNKLQWQTASEQNNEGFEIERSSNAKDWKQIGFLEGRGTTVSTQNYDYLDEAPLEGKNYYRLKQVDTDGRFEYSEISVVEWKEKEINDFQFFPSPTQAYFTIETTKKGTLQIFNVLGEIVLEQYINDLTKIDVSSLSSGLYFLKMNGISKELIIE